VENLPVVGILRVNTPAIVERLPGLARSLVRAKASVILALRRHPP
jgi:hypothetical protein